MNKLEINLKKDEFYDFFEDWEVEREIRKFTKSHIKTNIVNKTGKFIGPIEISTRVLSNNYKITVTVEES